MIAPLTFPLAMLVAASMRPADRLEVEACGHDDPAMWAAQVCRLPGERWAFIAADGEPVAMGGATVDLAGGVAITWFVATDRVGELGAEIHREAIRMHRRLGPSLGRGFLAWSHDGNTGGRRWLDRLGYQPGDQFCLHGHPFTEMRRAARV